MVNRLYIICIGLAVVFAIMLSLGGSMVNAAERSSTSYGIETDVLDSGGATGESTLYKMENSSLGEPFQAGSMESTSYAIYGEFQETLGTSPEIIGGTMQYLRNNITMIATGEWINDDTVVFRFTMSDPDPSNFLMAQVEIRPTTDAFTGQPNCSGLEVPYAGGLVTGIATSSGIASDVAYHWQARVIDDEFRASPWKSFSNNLETAIDFGIDQTPPYIHVDSPNGGEYWGAYSLHNVLWTAYDSGSGISKIDIYYSTNEGTSWYTMSLSEINDGIYPWTLPNYPTTEARVRVVATNNVGLVATDESDLKFRILGSIFPTSRLTAEALATVAPTYVRLYWLASTSEAVEGYYIYRGTAYGVYDPTPLNGTLVTDLYYDDTTVAPYVNYYYAVKTYSYGRYSPYSNDASAPLMRITRIATVESPQAGGYSGGKYDPVPGSTIKYIIRYDNIGFGLSINTILNDKIPKYTEFKYGGATGEAYKTIRYSQNNGATYNYAPSNAQITDPLVTNISWEVNDINAGYGKVATFEVIIR
jgi:hypothetical protein